MATKGKKIDADEAAFDNLPDADEDDAAFDALPADESGGVSLEIGPAQIETPEQRTQFLNSLPIKAGVGDTDYAPNYHLIGKTENPKSAAAKKLQSQIENIQMYTDGAMLLGGGVSALRSGYKALPKLIYNTPKGVKSFLAKAGAGIAGGVTGGPVGFLAGWNSVGPKAARTVDTWAARKFLAGEGAELAKKTAAAAEKSAVESSALTEGRFARKLTESRQALSDRTITAPKTGKDAINSMVRNADAQTAQKAKMIELQKQSNTLKGAKAHKIASETDPAYRASYQEALSNAEGPTQDLPVKNWKVEDYPLADLLKSIGK